MNLLKTDSLGNAPALSVNEIVNADIFFSSFPNPANNSSIINISLPHSQEISLELYDAQGKLVKLITKEKVEKSIMDIIDISGRLVISKQIDYIPEGKHNLNIDISDIEKDMYLCKIKVGDYIETKRFVKQ